MRHGVRIGVLIFGLLVIAAGVLLFAFNAGILAPEYKSIVFSWPALLLAFGFSQLFAHRGFFGLIMMLLGCAFLLPKCNIDRLNIGDQNGWAIALVIFGIFLLYNAIWGRAHRKCRSKVLHDAVSKERYDRKRKEWEKRRESGYIDRNNVFGGSKEKLDIRDFKGGDINCVFGGIELDLSDAQLAEGTHTLEINSVFGGVVLYMPIEWKIEMRQDQVFGHFVDSRPKPGFEVNENSLLILEVTSVFGGGEIKCKDKAH
jgi:predicted membrane protein